MATFIHDIRQQLGKSDTLQKLLVVNVVVFLLINIAKGVMSSFMMSPEDNIVTEWLAVPASVQVLITRPWTLITYMFLHEQFLHILFNMLWLYWMGRILQEYLGSKKLFSTYILGGISGGLLYVITYNLLPLFKSSGVYNPMLGASASVIAIIVATATLLPNYSVNIILLGPVALKYIAGILVVIDLISFGNHDNIAHFAHLGGAIFGFTYIRQLKKGNDLAAWFNKIMDKLAVLFKSSPRSRMKVKYKRSIDDDTFIQNKKAHQERVDEILDKISKSGYGSLTKDEKDYLFKSSKEN